MRKNDPNAPSTSDRAYLDIEKAGELTYSVSLKDKGWQTAVSNGEVAGITGQNQTVEALKMELPAGAQGDDSTLYSGSIVYKPCIQGSGWASAVSGGTEAGVSGSGKRIEAIQISLTGELQKYCNIYYRVHVQKYGWLGWAMNGQTAGTESIGYRIEAIQVQLLPKTASAPGPNSGYFQNTEYKTRYENAISTILNSAGKDLYSCFMWIVRNFTYKTLPIPMAPPSGYTREEGYAIYGVENRKGNCYCFAAAFAGAARKLGYDARYIEGRVGAKGGGTTPHGWVEIVQNGTTYVCDPDGQYELGGNFYMVTYGSARLRYYK